MDKEYESEFSGLDLYDINLNDTNSPYTMTVKLRRTMSESKEGFKELVDYLGKAVVFCIHISTDSKFQVEGIGHFWVKPKQLKKHNYSMVEITMEYEKKVHKKIIDLWKHECTLFLDVNDVQPELPGTEE